MHKYCLNQIREFNPEGILPGLWVVVIANQNILGGIALIVGSVGVRNTFIVETTRETGEDINRERECDPRLC